MRHQFASFAFAQLFPGCADVEIVGIVLFATAHEKGCDSK